MSVVSPPTVLAFAAALLMLALQAHSNDLQDEGEMASATPPVPTTCAELRALGATVDLTRHETGVLRQRCDAEDIRAKFAEVDRDRDGYLTWEELPVEHPLSTRFAEVDFDADKRLSLAEVAEHDAETDPIE